ncbi:hypothetical protein WICPIJ_002844 [Wickerhamomyces pijperi]|uniref:Major facilitator superfamily (MFS) profile domain-containing protein n=1 Tax=Wickerhamomyces pijperi TaxID=599730 RepID=A0A9P8TP97_WICPI|nr:hypothetical protein WICPIJ_002844 [Wickerhamomyces pijperi]
MRATALPSLPEMPMRNAEDTQSMQLKVLYSLDNNNFLARTPNTFQVRTARVVLPGQSNLITLGVIPIKEAIIPIINASPELFEDFSVDYSIYVKDVSEEDEPFVGHGLVSKFVNPDLANQLSEELLIPGRVCSSFTSFLGNGGGRETLEIKLKLVRVKRVHTPQPQQQSQQEQHIPMPVQQTAPVEVIVKAPQRSRKSTRKPSITRAPSRQPNFIQTSEPTSAYKRPYPQDKSEDEVFMQPQYPPNRKFNTAPAQRAVRTQSLPAFEQSFINNMGPKSNVRNFPPESIARRIHMADKQNSLAKSNPNYEPVHSRFNNLQKSENQSQQQKQQQQQQQQNHQQQHQNTQTAEIQLPPTATFLHPAASTSNSVTDNKPLKESKSNQITCSNPNCNAICEDNWHYYQAKEDGPVESICNQCFIFIRERGVMRPKGKTIQPKRKKQKTDRRNANLNSDPPSTIPSSSPPPVLTPVDDKKTLNQQNRQAGDTPADNGFINSSDPLSEFDHIIHNSDLDFQIGPLTDIDPLPVKSIEPSNLSIGKENRPPPIQLKKYNDQSNFEKMLVRSFSGYPISSASPSALINTGATQSDSPGNWLMPDIFQDIDLSRAAITPAATLIVDTPRDAATCNTLPIESPEKTTPLPSVASQHKIVKKKINGAFPSSPPPPFRDQQTDIGVNGTSCESSPTDQDSMMNDDQKKTGLDNNSSTNWASIDSDFTRLSSDDGNNILTGGSSNKDNIGTKLVLKADSEGSITLAERIYLKGRFNLHIHGVQLEVYSNRSNQYAVSHKFTQILITNKVMTASQNRRRLSHITSTIFSKDNNTSTKENNQTNENTYELQPIRSQEELIGSGGEDQGFTQEESAGNSDFDPTEITEAPDGGLTAWLVVLGGSLAACCNLGVMNSIGSIQTYIQSHETLQTASLTSIGWCFSVYFFFALGAAILTGSSFDSNGARFSLIVGNLLLTGGLVATASCTTVWQFVLAFGIVTALGTSFILTAILGSTAHWFDKKRGTALGFVSVGGSLGAVLWTLMFRQLFPKWGFSWTMRFLALICCVTLCVCTFLIKDRRVKSKQPTDVPLWKKLEGSLVIQDLFTDFRLSLLTVSVFLAEFSLIACSSYIGSYVVYKGFSESDAFLVIITYNACGILGRYIPNMAADFIGSFNVLCVTVAICTVLILVLWLPFGASLGVMYAFAALYGFFSCSILSLTPVCCGQIGKTKDFGKRYGTIFFVSSFGNLISLPLCGAIIKDGSGYNWLLVFAGLLEAVSLVFWITTRVYCAGFNFKKF